MGEPVNQHHEDVRASVRKKGATLRDLADRAHLHVTSISHCLRRPLPAANAAVAEFLGLELWELWPEWFGKDGKRTPHRDANRNRESAKRRNPEIAKRKAA